jgi:hypothetical protein
MKRLWRGIAWLWEWYFRVALSFWVLFGCLYLLGSARAGHFLSEEEIALLFSAGVDWLIKVWR